MKIMLLGFVLGVLSLTYQWSLPTSIWICAGVVAAFLCLVSSVIQLRDQVIAQSNHGLVLQGLLFVAAIVFGHGYSNAQLEQALDARLKQPTTITAVVKVKGISDGVGERWRQVVAVQDQNNNSSKQWLLYSAYSWDDGKKISAPAMQPNQLWQVTVKLKPPHSFASFGAFDSEKWLLEQHIMATGTIQHARLLSQQEVAKLGLNRTTWFEQFDTLIQQQRLAIRHHMDQFESPARGVMLGLLTGDRSLIDAKTTQLYQHMGISHLLAISGPHVVLAAVLITAIYAWILSFFPTLFLLMERQRWLLPIFFMLVLVYACLAGFELPAQRTVVMVGLTTGLFWWRQRWNALFILLIAASLILLFDPLASLSAAFWLSFGAVGILLMMSQDQSHDFSPLKGLAYFSQKLRQFVILQWRLFILLIPLVLFIFNQISILSPLINLIAIPFLTLLIVPLNLLAWAVSAISWDIANTVWQCLLFLLNCFHVFLAWIADLFPKALVSMYLGVPALIALSLAFIIVLMPKGVLPRWWIAVLLIPVFWPYRVSAPLIVHVLDVGQGLSVIVQTKQHTILVDAGSKLPSQQEGMGEKVVIPALQSLGIDRLDKLMLTHLDNDHSGGAPAVIANTPIIQLMSSQIFEPYSTHLCEAGQQWAWDGILFKVLAPWPSDNITLSDNDASCVLMIEAPANGTVPPQRILIMGDAGFYPEFLLQQKRVDLKADILLLGHHGSRHSSSSSFLQAVAPQRAVVSAGFLNRYQHPAPVVLRRLQAQGIAVDSTISSGTLSYYVGQSKHLTPLRYRDQRPWLQRDINVD